VIDQILNYDQLGISLRQYINLILLTIILFSLRKIFIKNLIPYFFRNDPKNPYRRKFGWALFYILCAIFCIGIIFTFEIDRVIIANERISISISNLFQAFIIFQVAQITDWAVSVIFLHNVYLKRDVQVEKRPAPKKDENEERGSRTVRKIVYVLAAIVIISAFNFNVTLFEYQLDSADSPIILNINKILNTILIFLLARVASWVIIQILLFGYYNRQEIDAGHRYSLNRLITYIIYVGAFMIAMETLGFKMTVIWGGAAALLVGIGLGLQDVFRDFISGIILLFDRTIRVGDVIELDMMVGEVQKIDLRVSTVITRDNIVILIPNSKLITDKVINWSHSNNIARFRITVGVAYGSDTEKVYNILIDEAKKHPKILEYPTPIPQMVSFGNSSLDFHLYFWSTYFMQIEFIKSELRMSIDKAFRENGVTIPFPLRDLWFRNTQGPDQETN